MSDIPALWGECWPAERFFLHPERPELQNWSLWRAGERLHWGGCLENLSNTHTRHSSSHRRVSGRAIWMHSCIAPLGVLAVNSGSKQKVSSGRPVAGLNGGWSSLRYSFYNHKDMIHHKIYSHTHTHTHTHFIAWDWFLHIAGQYCLYLIYNDTEIRYQGLQRCTERQSIFPYLALLSSCHDIFITVMLTSRNYNFRKTALASSDLKERNIDSLHDPPQLNTKQVTF